MVRRETDSLLANRISNDPAVISNVSYDGRALDWSPAIDTCVVLSNGEDAIQYFEQKWPRGWEVMTVFGPTCRGKRALETAREMKAWMLPYMDVAFGYVPDALPASAWFHRQLGCVPVDEIVAPDGIYTAREGGKLYKFEVN